MKKNEKETIIENGNSVLQPGMIEIATVFKATIPTGEYENFQPLYSIKEVIPAGENPEPIYNRQRELLLKKIQEDYERIQAETIRRRNPDLRFYERNGKLYPSVTSIINWRGIDFPAEQLKQYAARGTILHELLTIGLRTGEVPNPETLDNLAEDILILKLGDLRLRWDDVDVKAVINTLHKEGWNFEKEPPQIVYNDVYRYAGLPDAFALLKTGDISKKGLVDFKFVSKVTPEKVEKWGEQLVAYQYCFSEPFSVLAVIPITPGREAKLTSDIIFFEKEEQERLWQRFLLDREHFRKVYGV